MTDERPAIGTPATAAVTPAFQPSDVFLGQLLVGSMRRAEAEFAAIVVVRACVRAGNVWAPIGAEAAIAAIVADEREGVEPLASYARNPFFRPNPAELERLGFGRFESDGVEFTEAGFAALERHVRRRS